MLYLESGFLRVADSHRSTPGTGPKRKPVAARLIRGLADAEAVVVPSGSCGAMIKNFYAQLFAGSSLAADAASLAARTFEFSDFSSIGLA